MDRWERLKELRNTRGVTDVQDTAKQGLGDRSGGLKQPRTAGEEASTGRKGGEGTAGLTDSDAHHG